MEKTPLWIKIAIIAGLVLLLLGVWIFVYDSENLMQIERCIHALNNGRGYEILVEDNKFMTKADDHINLMQFLEGQYQMVFHSLDDQTAEFERGSTIVKFAIRPVRFNFLIWERIQE